MTQDTDAAAPSEPTYLTFDAILAAETAAVEETVYLPAWGGHVKIRALTMADMERIEQLATDRQTGEVNADKKRALALAKAVIQPPLEMGQVSKLLADGRVGAVMALWQHVNRVSGFGAEALDAAKSGVGE